LRLGAFAPADPEPSHVALQLADLDLSWPHFSAQRAPPERAGVEKVQEKEEELKEVEMGEEEEFSEPSDEFDDEGYF
jgi:hypothetical protein